MLDIKWIRQNPIEARQLLIQRKLEPKLIDDIIALDKKARIHLNVIQEYQEKRNTVAANIGKAKKTGENADHLIKEGHSIREKLYQCEQTYDSIKKELYTLLAYMPNTLAQDVPEGTDEGDNQVLRTVGTVPSFAFTPKEHYELFPSYMDFDTAAQLSGSRFVCLKGPLARLERALAQFMLDTHTQLFGFTEVSPPLLLKEESLIGTAQLPKFAEDAYVTTKDRWLLSTAEIPLTNLMRERIVEESALPYRFVAHTPCFRSEAGSAGRDTKGMLRQHQFYKVELVSICTPEQGAKEHAHITKAAEHILKELDLPYRVVSLCTGDIGHTAARTFDLEVWLPGQNKYREISSCSWCFDYQARRMNTRFKRNKTSQFVHTLNGSGLAVGRTLIAILENYQTEKGTLTIPKVLERYMGGCKEII